MVLISERLTRIRMYNMIIAFDFMSRLYTRRLEEKRCKNIQSI